MKMRCLLVRIIAIVIAVVLVAVAGALFYFMKYLPNTVAKQSFPQIDGQLIVNGLTDRVDIYRDQMGIPQIYASNSHDLFFAQGFVHAQDRFWQMDAWRHIGSGRLSEMFGKGQVETDAFLRTLGWKQTAEAEWDQLDAVSRDILLAYTEGVNAYLKDHKGTALSLEYAVLKLLSPSYQIEEWTPVNSLTWGKAMAWDLRGNMDEEIERAVLLKTLTLDQINELFPAYPTDHPVIVKRLENSNFGQAAADPTTGFAVSEQSLAVIQQNVALLDSILGEKGDGIGSNSWALSGKLTATGKPFLANDPHLGIQMPSIWYQIGMHCQPKTVECPYKLAGFSFAGVPGVIIGHNDRISWGFTNVGPDVMDLYIEKVNPENPNQYEVNGKWVDFVTRNEEIKIAGGKTIIVNVRSTRHGPVISDVYGPLKDQSEQDVADFIAFKDKVGIELPQNYAIALKWTALSPSTPFKAVWGFDRAQNWDEFRTAAQEFHVPAQNLIYADVDGNIGYQMPGDIPIRAHGDGRLPVPGWSDDYEWQGFIPFELLPYTFNPPDGYIVAANNEVAPQEYQFLISSNWDYGFRAQRIEDLISSAPGKIDSAYVQEIQGDKLDANALVFIPLLTQLNMKTSTPNQAIAMDLLQKWDNQTTADSAAAAVFESFWKYLLQNTFDDDLPKDYWPEGGSRWNEVMRRLSANSSWWDDSTTQDTVETRDDILRKSFAEAVIELEDKHGNDPLSWNWGEMHTATFRNQTLGESGVSFIEKLFNRGPFATGGGESIIDATGWSITDGYEINWLPSMRMIVDLGNLNNSLTVHTTGESGHAYNNHYTDMIPLWTNIQYYPMLWDNLSTPSDYEGHLVISPN